MYRIAALRLAGDGWWEGLLEGPANISIPIKRKRPGASEEDIWTMLQDKCDSLNISQGMVTISRPFSPTESYRRRTTIMMRRRP